MIQKNTAYNLSRKSDAGNMQCKYKYKQRNLLSLDITMKKVAEDCLCFTQHFAIVKVQWQEALMMIKSNGLPSSSIMHAELVCAYVDLRNASIAFNNKAGFLMLVFDIYA